jgi:hypothetical protein
MDEMLLKFLQPATLVAIVVDITELEASWLAEPDEAPPEETRHALRRLRDAAGTVGQRLHGTGFDTALAEEQETRIENDWLEARNAQDRKNWFEDYL